MPGILIHILPESLSTSPRNRYPHAPESVSPCPGIRSLALSFRTGIEADLNKTNLSYRKLEREPLLEAVAEQVAAGNAGFKGGWSGARGPWATVPSSPIRAARHERCAECAH
jgi:hypothetical protein